MDLRLSTLMSDKGRLTRKEYFLLCFCSGTLYGIIYLLGVTCLCKVLYPDMILSELDDLKDRQSVESFITALKIFISIAILLFIPLAWLQIVASIKRCHDIGRSGCFFLYALIPFAGIIANIILFFQDSEKGANQWGVSTKYPNGDGPRSQSFHQDYLGSPTHGQQSPSHEQRAIQQNSFHKELTSSDTEVVPPLSQNAKNIIIVVGLIFLSVIIIFGYIGCSTASKLSSPSPFPSKTSSDSSSQKNLQEIEDTLKELDE